MGCAQWRSSNLPEHASSRSGVSMNKFSRLTRGISTSVRRRKTLSRCRTVVTPPKPPPTTTMRIFPPESPDHSESEHDFDEERLSFVDDMRGQLRFLSAAAVLRRMDRSGRDEETSPGLSVTGGLPSTYRAGRPDDALTAWLERRAQLRCEECR